MGSDIFFAQGEYQPETEEGRELIKHELTHVIQQDGKTPFVQLDKETDDTTVFEDKVMSYIRENIKIADDFYPRLMYDILSEVEDLAVAQMRYIKRNLSITFPIAAQAPLTSTYYWEQLQKIDSYTPTGAGNVVSGVMSSILERILKNVKMDKAIREIIVDFLFEVVLRFSTKVVGFVVSILFETIVETAVAFFVTKTGESEMRGGIDQFNSRIKLDAGLDPIQDKLRKALDAIKKNIFNLKNKELTRQFVFSNETISKLIKNSLKHSKNTPFQMALQALEYQAIIKEKKDYLNGVFEDFKSERKKWEKKNADNDYSLAKDWLQNWALQHADNYKSFALGRYHDDSPWKLLMTTEGEGWKNEELNKKLRPLFDYGEDFRDYKNLFLYQTKRLFIALGITTPNVMNSINKQIKETQLSPEYPEAIKNKYHTEGITGWTSEEYVQIRPAKIMRFKVNEDWKKNKIDHKKFIRFLKDKFDIDLKKEKGFEDYPFYKPVRDSGPVQEKWTLEEISFVLQLEKYDSSVYIKNWYLADLNFILLDHKNENKGFRSFNFLDFGSTKLKTKLKNGLEVCDIDFKDNLETSHPNIKSLSPSEIEYSRK